MKYDQLHAHIESDEQMDVLLEAASKIETATEQSFKDMKNKKWYKRFWEIITFSKNNEKVLAAGVQSLAEMQSIIIQLLLICAENNEEIFTYVKQNADAIENLSERDKKIAHILAKHKKELERIKYGDFERPLISKIGEEERYLIMNAIYKLISSCENPPEVARQYLHTLNRLCPGIIIKQDFDYSSLKNLSPHSHACAAQYISEFACLTDAPNSDAFEKLKRYMQVSPQQWDSLFNNNMYMLNTAGGDAFVKRLEGELDDVTSGGYIYEVELIEAALEEDYYISSDEAPKKCSYKKITNVIQQTLRPSLNKNYPVYLPGGSKKGDSAIQNYIDKNKLLVVPETVISLADNTISGKGGGGYLFTTYGIYIKELAEKLIEVPYNAIDYSESCLRHDKKKKDAFVLLKRKDGKVHLISCSYVNGAAFLDMLNAISDVDEYAPTDKPTPLDAMPKPLLYAYIQVASRMLSMSGLPIEEAIRFAYDLHLSRTDVDTLIDLISYNADIPTTALLQEIIQNAPYGSEQSIKSALIQDLFRLLHLSQGSADIKTLTRKFVADVADVLKISEEQLNNYKIVGQANQDIISGKYKSVKELSAVKKAATAIGLAAGTPLLALFGSTALFMYTWWFMFIPGIGTILTAAAGGLSIAGLLINKNKKESTSFKEMRADLISQELESYDRVIKEWCDRYPDSSQCLERLNTKKTKLQEYIEQ